MPSDRMAGVLARCMPDGECLVWPGATSSGGYPKIVVNGRAVLPHRELLGVTEGRVVVEHSCGDKRCLNVEHMRLRARNEPRPASNQLFPRRCQSGEHELWGMYDVYVRPSDGGSECRKCRRRQAAFRAGRLL